MNFVSVIIPAFNRQDTIGRALESVLQQTYQHFEVLVIDDGSSDTTSEKVLGFIQYDRRISYRQHDRNRGAQAARNTGIEAAKGDWIAFLDSDDQWLPESLATRLALAQKEKLQVVYSACDVIWENGRKEPFPVPPRQGFIYPQLLTQPGPTFPSLLVSTKALKKIGGLDEQLVAWQEWDTAIRLAKHFPFGFVTQPTFIYNCQRHDTISKSHLRNALGYEQVIHKHSSEICRFAGLLVLLKHYREVAFRYELAGQPSASQYYPKLVFVYAKMAAVWRFLRIRRLLQKAKRFLGKSAS